MRRIPRADRRAAAARRIWSAPAAPACYTASRRTDVSHSGAMRKHRTRNLEIPRCAIAHLRSGPSDHPGMTSPGCIATVAMTDDGLAHEIPTLLLAGHSGPRRICPPRAGGCRRRLCRHRAQRARHGRDDEDDGGALRQAAVRAAVSQGRKARDRANRQYPALSRIAPWSGAEGGGGTAMGASIATHHRGFCRGDSRYPSSDRRVAVLRGPASAGEKTHRGILEGTRVEISGLFRAAVTGQWRVLSHRPQGDLCRSLAVADYRGAALRVSETHEGVRARVTGRGQ